MKPSTARLYRQLRRQWQGDLSIPMTAKSALQRAKFQERVDAFPFHYDGDTLETEDGFTVTLKTFADYCSADDLFGDTFGEFIEPRDLSEYRHGPDGFRMADERRLYVPNRHWTFADRVAQCRKDGMAKNPAWLAALAGLEREADMFERLSDEGSIGVTMSVTRTDDPDGEEWGEDTLGGIEESGWRECVVDYDMCGEALADARKKWALHLEQLARIAESARPDMYAPETAPSEFDALQRANII